MILEVDEDSKSKLDDQGDQAGLITRMAKLPEEVECEELGRMIFGDHLEDAGIRSDAVNNGDEEEDRIKELFGEYWQNYA